MAKVKARPSLARTKQRCPRCQLLLTVPDREQIAASQVRPEEYALAEQADEASYQQVTQPSIVAECPVCRTRISASLDQLGEELECPDCGTLVVVPAPPELPPRENPSPIANEEYGLLEVDQPSEAPQQELREIPVTCLLCRTLMYAGEDQVGKHILCPDCHTPAIVQPPADEPEQDSTAVTPIDEEYEIRREPIAPDVPKNKQPADQTLIAVVCKLCDTRMHATADKVGRRMICPDCGTRTVVPPPAAPRKPLPESEPGGDYGVSEPVERTAQAVVPETRVRRIEPEGGKSGQAASIRNDVRYVPKPPPPRLPFLTGVFNFPFYDGTWQRLVALMMVPVVIVPLLIASLLLGQAPEGTVSSAVPWFGSMAFFIAAGLIGTIWGVVASAHFLVVVQETADGNDVIESWPGAIFSDWMFDFLYIFNSLCISILTGVGCVALLQQAGFPEWSAVPLVVFLLFPISLLSMLESDSVVKPISFAVLVSLFTAWWAWALFYLETAVMLVAFAFLAGVAYNLAGSWGDVPIVILGVAVMFVYFRLLGRLGWCCGEASGTTDDDDDESQDEQQEQPADFGDPLRNFTARDATPPTDEAPDPQVTKAPPPVAKQQDDWADKWPLED